MRAVVVLLALLAVAPTPACAAETTAARLIDVLSYTARVTPHLANRSVTGSVDIVFTTLADLSNVEFDAGDLRVESASSAGQPLAFAMKDHRVSLTFGTPVPRGTTARVTIAYHGFPKRGVTFIAQPEQVYTAFSTSEWMVCLDDPSDKATLDLTVVTPDGWTVVSHDEPVSAPSESPGLQAHRFVLPSSASTYTYGFVAGRFASDVRRQVGRVALRYVGTDLDAARVARVFADTPDMVQFFESKAGVPFPTTTFTQVLTDGPVQQEAAGFVLLPKTYGPWVLDHPQDITLAAHELAHQWWGNRVTCGSWKDFWLNEGMATFMAAAYVEHRFGREAYDRLIAGYRADYERVRDAGHDKPLVFPDWSHPTADDRTLVYRKGAYVLSLLRETMGEDAFWAGILRFTVQFDGGSVESQDLQREMERASGSDLGAFFARWVFDK